jgi:hypothetical protein
MKNIIIKTMRTNKILMLTLVLLAGFTITSCVQDDDFTIPKSLGNEENQALTSILANIQAGTLSEVSISELKGMYQDNMPELIDTDIVVKGYVSSSDQTGNFYKELYLQDAPENPTSGIKIALNQVETYNQFNKGREVYIKLKGLYVGEERVGSEVIVIGGGTETDQFGTTVLELTLNQIKASMFRSENTMELVPITASFSDITKNHVGMFVKFDNVEFANDLEGLRYFDPIQDFDTSRNLQACGGFNYTQFKLETSGFASFKNELLPTGNGSVAGVITKTFDGSSLILALNSTDDVNLTGERCSLLNPDDFTAIFEEDFQTATNNTNLNFVGWTNYAEAGSWVWREKTFSGNGYTEFSTYNSGSPSNIAWLVTPGFDMDAQDNEFLNFKTAQHHLDSPNNTLEVFVSTDYDGTNVLTATWIPVSATLASQSNDWYAFVDSGLIDLSSYTGTLYVAFKVVGSGTDTTLDGAYQVDDFSIIASN